MDIIDAMEKTVEEERDKPWAEYFEDGIPKTIWTKKEIQDIIRTELQVYFHSIRMKIGQRV